MRRPLALLGAGLLALGLAGCAASPSGTGGRPELPTGVEVRFPAAPANAYLSLLTEGGQSVYQLAVPSGATRIEVDPSRWQGQAAQAAPIEGQIPEDSVVSSRNISASGVKVLLLNWVMWKDADSDGLRGPGEDLPLMTHDRVAYSNQAVKMSFRTTTPDLQQRWTLAQGWQRAEHFVYLPLNTTTYQRLLETNPLQRYTLHVPTPITSL